MLPDDLEARLRAHRASEPAEPPARRSAVSAVLRFVRRSPEVLLMTRAEHELDPWSGQVSLPGGRCEPEDPDLLATAIRETREELGLDLDSAGDLLCRLAPLKARARARILEMDVTPFVFRMSGAPEIVPGPEAAEAFWLPLEGALSGALDAEHTIEHEDRVLRLPCWRFEERVIWGMTYKMIRRVLEAGGALEE